MSTKTRSIIVLMIAVFTMLIVGTTKVNAVEITDEVLNEIPDTFNLNIKEIESIIVDETTNVCKAEELIKGQIIELLKNKGITVTTEDVNVIVDYYTDIHIGRIKIGSKEKNISIVYSNSVEPSEIEQQKISEILKGINRYLEVTPELSEWLKGEAEPDAFIDKELKPLQEAGYTIVKRGMGGSGGSFFCDNTRYCWIYKNDICYETIRMDINLEAKVTIPSTVEDTEEAIINYATLEIEKCLKEYTYIDIGDSIVIKKEDGEGDWYCILNNITQEYIGSIHLKKEKAVIKEDTTTGVKLDTTSAVLPINVILQCTEINQQDTINEVKETLGNTITKVKIYDINLLENNVKVQPNGKVKISIPIPSDYNKDRLTVYRIQEDGTKTEYTVKVEENYITFETDHFSIYVLAEKQATTNKGEKDDTPKTGTTDITNYIIAVATISAVGIVALKKKETK